VGHIVVPVESYCSTGKESHDDSAGSRQHSDVPPRAQASVGGAPWCPAGEV